jgi:hypothetical protein
MNSTDEHPPAPQKAGCMVRAFIIALPIGLAFMVPLSLWIYYQKKHQPEAAISQYAAMLRKDLNAEDFARYARILSQDIGERSLSRRENLDAAASFIESTMGYENMGYAVQRQVFDVQDTTAVNLIAELTGKTKPNEVVLVVANYDEADARGVAALMCVAHAFAGGEHARTIRFAAVMSEAGGLKVLRDRTSADNREIRSLIVVSSELGPDRGELNLTSEAKHFAIKNDADGSALLARLQELQRLVEQSADAR